MREHHIPHPGSGLGRPKGGWRAVKDRDRDWDWGQGHGPRNKMRRQSVDKTTDHQRCLSLHSSFVRVCPACCLLQGVGVLQSRLPASLFEHLSVGQVYHPPPKVLSCPFWPCVRGTMHHGRRNWAVPRASMGNRIGHLYSATASWRFFGLSVAKGTRDRFSSAYFCSASPGAHQNASCVVRNVGQ